MDEMKEDHDLAKWLAGEMPENERKAFEKSSGYETFAKIKTYSAQFESPSVDEKTLYENIIAGRGKREIKVFPLYRKLLRIAAIFVVLFGLGYVAMTVIPTTQTAQNRHTASFELPDASQVVLNAGSQITYKKWQWASNRRLNLTGEAFFKVAKGKQFEVSTDLGKVTVLGTQFNVKSRNGRFDVSCYEGRVKVTYNTEEIIISKGQSVAFVNGAAIEVPQVESSAPQWLNDKLAFEKETLPAIIEELARQYDITIELNGVSSGQLFSGTLPMKNLDEALQIVGSTYHLQIKKENRKIILQALDAQN